MLDTPSPDTPSSASLPVIAFPARAISNALAKRPERSTLAAFRSAQAAVRKGMFAGLGLSAVEDELIDPAPLAVEWKAALWLFSWSLMPPAHQLAEVEAHVDLLSRCGAEV